MIRKLKTLFLLMSLGITSTAMPQLAHALENGETLNKLSGKKGELIRHTLEVPEGAGPLIFRMSGGTGDADLYVRIGAKPTTRRFNCRPFRTGNNESCIARNPRAGIYHIMIRAYTAYQGVSFTARYEGGSDSEPPTQEPPTQEPPTQEPPTQEPPTQEPPIGTACLNEVQEQLLAAHNAFRVQGRECGGTYFPAVPALTWSCPLGEVAKAHSTEMGTVNYFSHTGADGSDPGQRMTAGGYTWRAYGENIAAGQPTVDIVMQGWINSPGHCSNIMSPNVTEMGASKVSVPGADYSAYWTALFGRPQ